MTGFVGHNSSLGRLWVHLAIKVKYCHKMFRIPELGIDEDHVHFVLDAGLYPLPKIVKKLKGYTAKRLFQEYPWLKRQYFWGSGLWNPSYYFDSLGQGIEQMATYVRMQGKVNRNSTSLIRWLPVTGG